MHRSTLGKWLLPLFLLFTPLLVLNLSGCCGCDLDELAKKNPSDAVSNTWVSGDKSFTYDAPVFIYHDGSKARYYRGTVTEEDKEGNLSLRLKRVNKAGKKLKGKSRTWKFRVVSTDSLKVKRAGTKKYTLWQKTRQDPVEIVEAIAEAEEGGLLASTGSSGSSSSKSRGGRKGNKSISSTAVTDARVADVIEAYEKNVLKANTTYRGKRFRLTSGYVGGVRRNYNQKLTVDLTPSKDGYGSDITVEMLESEVDRAMALKTGDSVVIIATGDSEDYFKIGAFE